jgi:hypothetical protein
VAPDYSSCGRKRPRLFFVPMKGYGGLLVSA